MLPIMMSLASAGPADAKPISLHPENGHYLLFRGKPAVLVTSGEHYGAVLNLDFDYIAYLDALKADGMNLTRLFSGIYREIPGSFSIAQNTLAPAPGRYIAPWARSSEPGYDQGGNKFDLTKWDDAFFRRLRDFVSQAGKRGIVVEMVLFCPFYEEALWKADPMNAANNVNGIGSMGREEVYTLKHPEMVAVHDALARKFAQELNPYDNFYFEICNEPYFGGITLDWQRHIAQTLVDAEKGLPNRHLIAQNIANDWAKIEKPFPEVSIFNFHYASPPRAVTENYGLNRVISFDETGFVGTKDETYRRQAWQFILAGGGIFDNLDYSFTASHPKGDFQYPQTQPGGGSPAFRQQMRILSEFMRGLDFIHMRPDRSVVSGLGEGVEAYALVKPGAQYAVYLHGPGQPDVTLALPAGRYRAEWLNTLTGKVDRREEIEATGGSVKLAAPAYALDVALRVTKR